jgi:hypothetical protein
MKKSFLNCVMLSLTTLLLTPEATAEFGAPHLIRLNCERETQASGPLVLKSRGGDPLLQFAATLTLELTPEGMATDAAIVSTDLGECIANPHFGARGPSFMPSQFRLGGYKCRAGQVEVSVWEHPRSRQPAGAVLQVGKEYWACGAE